MVISSPRSDIFRKRLSANDVGATGSHQAGILVPKNRINHFPVLNSAIHNPEVWLSVIDPAGYAWEWRFVHFNGRDLGQGTRSEYRLTGVTPFLQQWTARGGSVLEMSRRGQVTYDVRII